jgi:hypothetical protein
MIHSSPELSKSTQLILTYILSDEWQYISTVDIKCILNITQIYHLMNQNIYTGSVRFESIRSLLLSICNNDQFV